MSFCISCGHLRALHSFPTRRSSDLNPPSLRCERIKEPAPIASTNNSGLVPGTLAETGAKIAAVIVIVTVAEPTATRMSARSEEHTSELQSRQYLVCRLLLEKKKIYH